MIVAKIWRLLLFKEPVWVRFWGDILANLFLLFRFTSNSLNNLVQRVWTSHSFATHQWMLLLINVQLTILLLIFQRDLGKYLERGLQLFAFLGNRLSLVNFWIYKQFLKLVLIWLDTPNGHCFFLSITWLSDLIYCGRLMRLFECLL